MQTLTKTRRPLNLNSTPRNSSLEPAQLSYGPSDTTPGSALILYSRHTGM